MCPHDVSVRVRVHVCVKRGAVLLMVCRAASSCALVEDIGDGVAVLNLDNDWRFLVLMQVHEVGQDELERPVELWDVHRQVLCAVGWGG